MNRTIGILGGMGPMAACDLMRKIIDNTPAACDQEHLRIVMDNNTNIPDRTMAILGTGKDPRPEMIKSAVRLQSMGADVIVVSCNTAHYFLKDVECCVDIPILHMPRETARSLAERGVRSAAVLATDGTVQTGIYDRELMAVGIEPVLPDAESQKTLMSVIYDYIKAGKPYAFPEKLAAVQERLIQRGAEYMILGCTELPIAFREIPTRIPTIDPTTVLARAAVSFASSMAEKGAWSAESL